MLWRRDYDRSYSTLFCERAQALSMAGVEWGGGKGGGREKGEGGYGHGNRLLRNPQNVEVAQSEKGTPWSPAGVCSLSPGLAAVGTAGP